MFFRADLKAPWGFAFGDVDHPRFHIVLHGRCVLGSANSERTTELEGMEIVLLPGGDAHWLADRRGRRLTTSEHATEACLLAGGYQASANATNRLLCGQVRFDGSMHHPMLAALPQVLHVRELTETSRMWQTVRLIDTMMKPWSPEIDDLVVDRLAEVLFVEMLRAHVQEPGNHHGFFVALADRRLNRVLQLMHEQPAHAWTVTDLAAQAGLSRATLTRQFRDKVGVGPMEYLVNWRLTKAYEAVLYSATSLDQIAVEVGFGSAQTLTKAFRRRYELSPSAMRRSRQS